MHVAPFSRDGVTSIPVREARAPALSRISVYNTQTDSLLCPRTPQSSIFHSMRLHIVNRIQLVQLYYLLAHHIFSFCISVVHGAHICRWGARALLPAIANVHELFSTPASGEVSSPTWQRDGSVATCKSGRVQGGNHTANLAPLQLAFSNFLLGIPPHECYSRIEVFF